MQLRDRLRQLPKEGVLDVFKTLNGGTVGFDHEMLKKIPCVELLLNGEYRGRNRKGEPHTFTSPWTIEQINGVLPGIEAKHLADTMAASNEPQQDDHASAAVAAIKALAASSLNEAKVRNMIESALDAYEPPGQHFTVKVNDAPKVKIDGHAHPLFEKALRRAVARVNVLLIGPAGCGKSHLAEQIAAALQLDFASVNCTAGMSESNLKGWLLPTGEGGRFEYLPADFIRLFEGGGVFLIDEVDAADPNVLLLMNQALANGKLFLPQRKDASEVRRHPDFVCFAAANTFGTGANMMYAGRERLDESTLDRFRAGQMLMDYDTEFERAVCNNDLLGWAHPVRRKIAEARLSRVLSTRFLLDATKLMAAGETIDEVVETFFTGWKADERMKVGA